MTKLCRSCGRSLDDYARFCDRCGLVQPFQPPPQVQYQYPQPLQPTQVSPELAQPQLATVSPAEPPRAGILGRIRRRGKQPTPTGMPVPEVMPQQPPRPEAEAVVAPSGPAVKVTRWAMRPLGRKLNYVGILGGIVAFVSLIMPWWTTTAIVPVMGLGNSTAIEFPLYLYEVSGGILANPPSRVVILDLWFCWVALALVALAGILAVVGSVMIGKGKRILVIGGVLALLSIIVFAVGLQGELSMTGSGLDLFKTAEGTWGTLTANLSFGFWGAFVAAAMMLVAARRSAVITAAPPVTVRSRAPEVALAGLRVGRPLGVTLLVAYCSVLGICAIASVSFTSSIIEGVHQLPVWVGGIGVPDLTYLWVLLVFSAVVDFVIAYGLLRRKRLVRTTVRILSGLAVVGALIMIGLVAVLVFSPDLLGAGPSVPLTSDNATALYGGLAIVTLLGVILPLAVFWYMARPQVKRYFGIAESRL